jgi:thiol:disulfide interchange protein
MNALRQLVGSRFSIWKIGLPLLFLLLTFAPAAADDGDDPFSEKNKADPIKLDSGKPPDKAPGNNLGPEALLQRIRFTAKVSPEKARPGDVVTVTITGTPLNGNHTYPITQRTPDMGPETVSRIDYSEYKMAHLVLGASTVGLGASPLGTGPFCATAALMAGRAEKIFKPLWPVKESEPTVLKEFDGQLKLVLAKEFTWQQDLYIRPNAAPGKHWLDITPRLMVCDDHGCTQPGTKYPTRYVNIEVVPGSPTEPSPELQKRLAEKPPAVKVVVPQDPEMDQSLWGFIIVSISAAGLMLLTPCVFPMIPITVSFFLKQSEKEHHSALLSAGVYSLTIIVVLALAVFLLGSVIVKLANDPWLNLGLGVVLVFFALSLFGMYEIELPSFLARFTSAREGQGGMAGAFFMALTFTITSFTCTGPFLGPLLAGAATAKLGYDKLILGAVAYAATFAAPFFVLALFPKLLKTLPKSGSWLNAIKVVMGFLELAAALKFIANTDLAWNPGDPILFSYDSVLCAWIAISVACGMYLFGLYRLPHDSPNEHIGVVRMLFASIFLGLAVYMAPALWRVVPQGAIGKGLVAFLPLDTRPDLDWYRDPQEAWAAATRNPDKPVPIFIDFTGVNCTNCRYNEKNVFTQPKVKDLFKGFVRLQMYTDTVPEKGLSASEALAQAERNSQIQGDTFGDITNPFYAIVLPNRGKEPWVKGADGKLKINGTILGIRKGLIPDNKIRDFVAFLESGQK